MIIKKDANSRQVGGEHYNTPIQHWDYAASNEFDYFQGQITKYVSRWKNKNGIEDLEKALHFLEKYIETTKEKYAVRSLQESVESAKIISDKVHEVNVQLAQLSGNKPKNPDWLLDPIQNIPAAVERDIALARGRKPRIEHPAPFGYDVLVEETQSWVK